MLVPQVRQAMAPLGYSDGTTVAIGILLLVCTIIHLIPRTSVFGALLLTAYLGGATASHVRAGQPFFFPIIFGVLIWAALVLRNPRLRGFIGATAS